MGRAVARSTRGHAFRQFGSVHRDGIGGIEASVGGTSTIRSGGPRRLLDNRLIVLSTVSRVRTRDASIRGRGGKVKDCVNPVPAASARAKEGSSRVGENAVGARVSRQASSSSYQAGRRQSLAKGLDRHNRMQAWIRG